MECRNRNRHKLILKTPASWNGDTWREALATGNGEIGLGVYGGVKDETILINHGALWHWGKRSKLPDVSDTLGKTRFLLDQGNYAEANRVSSQELIDRGYIAELYTPCPLADLRIRMQREEPFRAYRRILDMETGEVEVSWHHGKDAFRRRLFASRTDDLIVCEISGGPHAADFDLWPDLHRTGGPDEVRMVAEAEQTRLVGAEGTISRLAIRNEDETDFGLVIRVVTDNSAVRAGEAGVLQVRGTSRALILAKVFVKGEREDRFRELTAELEAVSEDYDALFTRHTAAHRALYRTANLLLAEEGEGLNACNEQLLLDSYGEEASPVLLEKLWRFSRHLFISGTREGAQPFALYGLWGGRYDLCWSHHMANINIQMMYWHAMTGGLVPLMEPFLRYYTGHMEDFRENARKLFGQTGICLSAGSTPGLGLANQVVPVITNWIGGAGWIARHFYETWQYTGDDALLRETVLPFLLEAAEFYEGYLVPGDDGLLRIYPSVSPENTPGNLVRGEFAHMSHACPTAQDATMDHAIIRELFTHLLEIGDRCGLPMERTARWQELLSKMPPYRINREGAVCEWMHDGLEDFYYHRHISHLYPVFPGRGIDGERDPALLEAFEWAVDLRILGGQSGWSLAQMANVYARFGKAEKAVACLDILCSAGLLKNFFTLHNDWRGMGMTLDLGDFAPVQLDALLGCANALQEMLLSVSPEHIHLLPTCPERFRKGRFVDFRFHSGRISLVWDSEAGTLEGVLTAERETDLILRIPQRYGLACFTEGACQAAPERNGDSCFRVLLVAGAQCLFHCDSGAPV